MGDETRYVLSEEVEIEVINRAPCVNAYPEGKNTSAGLTDDEAQPVGRPHLVPLEIALLRRSHGSESDTGGAVSMQILDSNCIVRDPITLSTKVPL